MDIFEQAKELSKFYKHSKKQKRALKKAIHLAMEEKATQLITLRRTLGDLLPGIVNYAAKLFDIEVPQLYKLLESNVIKADTFIPYVIDFCYNKAKIIEVIEKLEDETGNKNKN
jgi:hypothetical protein